MSVGTGGPENTATRSAVLAARGYPADVVAGNGHRADVVAGNGHQVDEVERVAELPAVDVEHQVATADATPAPSCCALAGCDQSLPPGRRHYCSTEHADTAELQRSRRREREAKKRARPSRSSSAAPAPPPAVDDRPRPGIGEIAALAAQLLASGAVAEVEVDGATLVARATR